MTITKLFKCEVCGCITNIKLEVGHIGRYEIYVPCKKCQTMFHGIYIQDDLNVSVKAQFFNAVEIEHEEADYLCTVSGDFISEKIRDVNEEYGTITLPMWMKFKDIIGYEEYIKLFRKRVPILMGIYNETQYEWERVLELWINENYYYFDNQIREIFDVPETIDINQMQRLSFVRKLTTTIFTDFYDNKEYTKYLEGFRNVLSKLVNDSPKRLKDYLIEIETDNLFVESERILYEQLKRSIEYIPNLIPMLSIALFSEDLIQSLFSVELPFGIYSVDFETLKKLYQDLYETNTKVLFISVGLENLLFRGDYNKFESDKFKSLKKYINEWKAFNKIDGIDRNTKLAIRCKRYMNNKLRNSIGHCDYKIDNITQVVYLAKEEKTLIEIAYMTYELVLETFENFCKTTLLHEMYLSGRLDEI